MKKLKKNRKKKIALIILIVIACISSYFIIDKERENKRAYVQKVSDLNVGYDDVGLSLYGSGIVSDEASQEIKLQSGEKVAEVYVNQGDTVTKDQKLFSYDASSLELNLEQEQLSLQQAQTLLKREQKKMNQITDMKAVSDSSKKQSSDNLNTLSEKASEAEQAVQDYQSEHADELLQSVLDADSDPSVVNAQTAYDNFSNGIYTQEEQAQINAYDASGDAGGMQTYISGHLNDLMQNISDTRNAVTEARREAYDNFVSGNYTSEEQNQIQSLQAKADQANKAYEDASNSLNTVVTESDKASMLRNQQVAVMKAQNQVTSAKAAVKTAQDKVNDTVVKAGMNGTVTAVNDPDTSIQEGKPYIVISASGGVSAMGGVSEFDTDKVKEGDRIKVTDYVSGSESEASILSISSFPDQSGQITSYGSTNGNTTYYPFTAVLDDPDGFNAGDSIEYKSVKGNTDVISLSRAYIRMDDKGAYTFIDDGNGKLKRQNVEITPSSQDPETVIVTKGLRSSDKIAFPYGKKAYEGNETTENMSTNILGF